MKIQLKFIKKVGWDLKPLYKGLLDEYKIEINTSIKSLIASPTADTTYVQVIAIANKRLLVTIKNAKNLAPIAELPLIPSLGDQTVEQQAEQIKARAIAIITLVNQGISHRAKNSHSY